MTDSIVKDLSSLLTDLLSNRKQMKKFRDFAEKFLKCRTNFDFARAYTPDDIISSIVEKILTGIYHWDKTNYTFIEFFWLRLRTFSENLIKHEKQFLPVRINEYDSECVNDDCEFTYTGDESNTPAEFIENSFLDNKNEDNNYIDPLEFTQKAFKLFSGIPEEYCVLDELYKGKKPREIAPCLGISVEEVFNIRKRIRRTLLLFYNPNL
jgi:hypothetical protein